MNVFVVSKSDPLLLIKPFSQPHLLLESQRRSEHSQNLLRQIKLHKQEVRCCCLPIPARMFVRFSYDFYTLVNHPSEGAHHELCPLRTVIHGYSPRSANNPVPNETSTLSHFNVHPAVSNVPHTPNRNNPSKVRTIIRECSVDKLVRHLIERSYHNYHYKNKSFTTMQALHKLVAPALDVPFGKTTLNHYIFYGKKGFEFAIAKLARVVKKDVYDGAGRPHALVFFSVSCFEQISPCLIQIDGHHYPVKKIHHYAKSSTNDACLIVLSLALNPTTSSCIEVYNAYVYPVLSETHFMPVESESERIVARDLVRFINDCDTCFSWSLSKLLFSLQDHAQSHSVLPSFVLKSKNKSRKVNFIEVIEVVNSRKSNDRKLLPLSLELWQANLSSQVDPTDSDSLSDFRLRHKM